ncbi:tetratricopeptide repeat protein [Kutzneria albida]|uniref:tetratricopeptide repeat protein n=1 Tax=Kutzneria albida TaxID=43357 RepID=UPI00046D6F89|nr:tetratricopeptide repeat protein [Kutzneria albida]
MVPTVAAASDVGAVGDLCGPQVAVGPTAAPVAGHDLLLDADQGGAEALLRTGHVELAICCELDHRHGEASTLDNIGITLLALGRPAEAVTAHERSIAIYRETGDQHGEALALHNLARAALAAAGGP